LLNRSGLAEALSREPVAAPRRFAVLCLDLDGFKNVNDTFGHQAGDDLLRAVAARLKSCIRATDILARLGGDEFVIIAPGLSPADSQRFANSIIERIVHQPCVIGAASAVPIGISIGVACAPEDGVDIDELRGKADAALYDAKRAGKGIQRRFGDATRADSLADLPS
jgi:diguanylate cyclase (GGDEF)-like protein